MIVDNMSQLTARRFELELIPLTRRDAAQAVLYRVGEPLDIFGHGEWSAACREALTERLLPRLRSRRKRWISAVPREDCGRLTEPPHKRPALLTAARLSVYLPGGLLIEKLSDLGEDPLHRAVVVTWLAEHAGMHGVRGTEDVIREIATNPMGTFTVGELVPRRGRRGTTARTDRPVQEHVRKLNAAVLSTVEVARDRLRYAKLYHLFDEAVSGIAAQLPEFEVHFAGHALSSQLVADLTVSAAREVAQEMRAARVHPVRACETLQLAGFINGSGNRLWNRELAERAGGWRD